MDTLLRYALPVGTALLLIVFFTGLPRLKTCRLPGLEEPWPRGDRLRPADGAVMLFLTAAYALTAFFNLGDRTAPQSFALMEDRSAVLELPEGARPEKLMLYCGVSVGSYELDWSAGGGEWTLAAEFEQDYTAVLKWHVLETEEPGFVPRYVRLRCVSGAPYLGELALLDEEGRPLAAVCDVPELCDEPETAPAAVDFHNSTYFDEIYHARTAWEHQHGVWPYEISHPPLGKLLIGLGISLFGMTPFGWRFSGTLLGALMLPVMYVFLKKLFGSRAVASLGTLIFASDFMHFVQTRIATIDTYSVFFILLMYLFMYLYLSRESLGALALSGLFFGFGIASKWTGFYAGGGLALLWAGHWVRKALASRRAAGTAGASPEPKPGLFGAFFKNCLFCLVFFVLVPGLIYLLAYIPYGAAKPVHSLGEYLRMVWDNQTFMFRYHSGVTATHPYSSRWYQWVLDIRPILYYLEYFDDGTRVSICAFLNPLLCWGGLLSLFVLLYTALFRRDRKAGFLLLGYFAQLVPWMFVTRVVFEYHYFPSSVFLVMALAYVFDVMRLNRRRWWAYAVPFVLASLALFALFFPALSGLPVDNAKASALLGWLPTWPI